MLGVVSGKVAKAWPTFHSARVRQAAWMCSNLGDMVRSLYNCVVFRAEAEGSNAALPIRRRTLVGANEVQKDLEGTSWQQATGEAIDGPRTRLTLYPVVRTTWG